jgi:hypothetical protein
MLGNTWDVVPRVVGSYTAHAAGDWPICHSAVAPRSRRKCRALFRYLAASCQLYFNRVDRGRPDTAKDRLQRWRFDILQLQSQANPFGTMLISTTFCDQPRVTTRRLVRAERQMESRASQLVHGRQPLNRRHTT